MTKEEEAIRQIRDNIDFRRRLQEGDKPQFFDAEENEKDIEAFEMAIKALAAIEDIKEEIRKYRDGFISENRHDLAAAAETCLMFIDKHISGKKTE